MVFTYPWFLIGLASIAIPIAIHLFELRRPQKLLFSNVEFIREVKLVTARQRKLRHLAVLAARIGLLSFLVLLFAQPFIPAPVESKSANGMVGVILDNSPSMRRLGRNEQSVLEHGIQEASALPLAFPATARYSLLPAGKSALGAPEYQVAVEQIQATGQNTDLGQWLLQNQQQQAVDPLFVFSDFQKKSFSTQSIRELDTTRQIFLVPLAAQDGPNAFVDSVWLDDAFVRQGVDLRLRIRLRNGGEQPATNCQVKVFVGRQQAAALQVSVPAQQTVTTQVRVRLSDAAAQACRVEIEDFPVDFDNTYCFTLQPATQISVVELATEQQLARLYANEPLFSYRHVGTLPSDYQSILNANLLVLREAPAISVGLRENLRRAVQQGASVVVIPSAIGSSQESYTRLFRELGVGSVQWQPQSSSGPVLQEVAMPSAQNPFFRDVFTNANQRAGMPKAAPILRWSRSSTDVLRMRDGQEYLAGFPSGKGMVYVFAAPLNSLYSDFAQHPLFVPVMYRLAMESYQQEQLPAYRLNQQTIALRLPKLEQASLADNVVYRLVKDSLTYIPVQRQQGGVLHLDVPPGLQEPGFYTLQRAGKTVATLAFNFDKRESDLRSYSTAELRQLVGPNRPNIQVYEPGQAQTVAAHYRATRVGFPCGATAYGGR
ncbi:BatA domain-containing protein [Hymenobacter sp. 5516J-16]|uniref:BatA domain-containing protein n=1 Tax=Hymenobacter sp. 5516J-16 TaxID=2932253 RepID=UPI001FD0E4F5|nr:BatA domain-containing protein [Hymenobacter sp. 5516J-16]UOQ77983.1 BatA domain-containing protein [Hymenobacter sp. 5516J-16]